MGKTLLLIAILSATLFLACASASPSREGTAIEHSAPSATSAPYLERTSKDSLNGNNFADSAGVMGPAGIPGSAGADGSLEFAEEFNMTEPAMPGSATVQNGDSTAISTLQSTQRRIISNASMSIEVETVEPAIDQVRAIVDGLGGFVEHLSSFGSEENQQANLTVRVPQDQFFTAVDRIEELGKVQNRNLGSEDVSEQFIDLEARLKSSLREEESLLSLLERADQVSEILTIERELSRVRSDIERAQGQLNFLERRVDLATISISLFPPGGRLPEPPAASMVIEESNVSDRVTEVKNLAATLNAEIDQVFLSTRDGRERADISFRVFPKDFDQAMIVLQSQGKIISREVREGLTSVQTQDEPPEDPNAQIDVTFTEPVSSNTGLIALIITIIVGVILVALATAFYLTYRAGRNRADRFIQSNA